MAINYNPKIVTKGLQFLYDDDNFGRSGRTKDLISGATITQTGTPNYALIPTDAGNLPTIHMTGNDGNGTAPAGSTGATVIFWNKRTGGSTGTWDRICEFRFGAPAQSRTWWIGYYSNVTDRIHCSQTFFTTAGGTTPQYSSIDPTWADAGLTLTIGQYYFHAWTYVNSTRERKYYINANLAVTNTRGGFGDLMNPGSGDMFIGGTSDTAYANHMTKIVGIYNRPLSATEITATFNSTKARFGY